MLEDRYKNLDCAPGMGIDCIMLTLDAGKYLRQTLDAFYCEVPIQHLYVMDGGSKDKTIDILTGYPRVTLLIQPNITHGKGFEILKDMVTTKWFIFIDVGKIPQPGWYDEMIQYTDEYDFIASQRINHYEFERLDLTVQNPNKRMLGGPWLIKKESIKSYRVDNDYVWRVLDMVLKRALEDNHGRYGLVESAQHKCYLTDGERYISDKSKRGDGLGFNKPSTIIYNKEIMDRRHDMTAKAIVKYLSPDQAKYFLDDHWMLMINRLDRQWIRDTNIAWIPVLKRWRYKRLLVAKMQRFMFYSYKKVMRMVYDKLKWKMM